MKKTIAPTRTILCKRAHNQPGQEKKTASKQPVKTLEIFISQLDQHIADSYNKLRNNKHKTISLNSTIKKQSHSMQSSLQKQPKRRVQGEFGTTMKKDLNKSRLSRGQIGFEEGQNPTLISNEQVTKYINFVYETYNIPDPMVQSRKQKKITIVRHSDRKSSLTTISLPKKSSLSSFKEKIVLQKNIDLTPMKNHEVQTHLSHLNTTNNSLHEQFDNSTFSNTLLSATSSYRKCESSKKDNYKRFAQNDIQNQTEVQQVFRYCFACQGHVLQKNLRFHQQLCKPLQEAYLKPYPQLLIMLNEKINRLTIQVQTGIIEAHPQKLISQFTNLKQAVSQWMGEISKQGDKENSKSIQNHQITAKYNSIQQYLSTNLNCHLQSLSRLSWFTRLRQNLVLKMKGGL